MWISNFKFRNRNRVGTIIKPIRKISGLVFLFFFTTRVYKTLTRKKACHMWNVFRLNINGSKIDKDSKFARIVYLLASN